MLLQEQHQHLWPDHHLDTNPNMKLMKTQTKHKMIVHIMEHPITIKGTTITTAKTTQITAHMGFSSQHDPLQHANPQHVLNLLHQEVGLPLLLQLARCLLPHHNPELLSQVHPQAMERCGRPTSQKHHQLQQKSPQEHSQHQPMPNQLQKTKKRRKPTRRRKQRREEQEKKRCRSEKKNTQGIESHQNKLNNSKRSKSEQVSSQRVWTLLPATARCT
mmetsp:Transcript_14841/g.20716  ORF Transcript_14841/g.20716 Transcript_14841/m.20716 type:complete len:217 (-) Transcript_14841:371-1021(-)